MKLKLTTLLFFVGFSSAYATDFTAQDFTSPLPSGLEAPFGLSDFVTDDLDFQLAKKRKRKPIKKRRKKTNKKAGNKSARSGSSKSRYSNSWHIEGGPKFNLFNTFLYDSTSGPGIQIGGGLHVLILQNKFQPFYLFGSDDSSQQQFWGVEYEYHLMLNSNDGEINMHQWGIVLQENFYKAIPSPSWYGFVRFRGGASNNEFYAVNPAETRDDSNHGVNGYFGTGFGIGLDLPPMRRLQFLYEPTAVFFGEGILLSHSVSISLAVVF